MSYIERDLFGGTIVAKTDPTLLDASELRQVPDTQEVLLSRDSGLSIIVEILQRVEPDEPDKAVSFHFDSLAHDNDATQTSIEATSVVPNPRTDQTPAAIILKGEQHVKKFNRTEIDRVKIYMSLFRVEEKGIDIVVTFNVPVETSDGGTVGVQGLAKAEEDFNAFIQSFQIKDFSLFA